ncbi:MAG: Indole-3-glycerol phosphate synthase (EC [uncultured Campylobacterales bacterium]|uniref:Indole-3-glycerol phosphate synthase n=1 Tax=uncultured Campylobacterales bacterium TaxID=352960 RepID=A0A6S6TBI5_9BACT|nr:MAG: Indole-3-glycerol phosphate synthase (EC [uncultured Campylobacterales bacterium]
MILDKIIKKTKEDLIEQKKILPYELLGRSLSHNPYPPRDIKSALRSTPENKYRIIAEVKKASPSKGIIKEDFDPLETAMNYEAGLADAISVLTEPHFFQGNLDYLSMIRRHVKTPLLRKDFIVDKYQVMQALVYGADFILLIACVLSKRELKELLEFTRHLGMEALVEVHDKEDLKKAIFAGADIIGINHRNLKTFDMDMKLCFELIPLIPNNKIIIAESGITDKKIITELSKAGADAFLIGEHFMREDDPVESLKELKTL